jgi:hypothetical protein
MISAAAAQAGISLFWLYLSGREKPCVCRFEHDQKLLEILEQQLLRCGPDQLRVSPCPPCSCEYEPGCDPVAWFFLILIIGILSFACGCWLGGNGYSISDVTVGYKLNRGRRVRVPEAQPVKTQGEKVLAVTGPVTPSSKHGAASPVTRRRRTAGAGELSE